MKILTKLRKPINLTSDTGKNHFCDYFCLLSANKTISGTGSQFNVRGKIGISEGYLQLNAKKINKGDKLCGDV